MISNTIIVLLVIVVVIGYLVNICRKASNNLILRMRTEGLTEQDIAAIVGTDGYRRLNKH